MFIMRAKFLPSGMAALLREYKTQARLLCGPISKIKTAVQLHYPTK